MRRAVWGIWLVVLGYFGWWGMTHPAWEGDSLSYHLPIARLISEGRWMDKAAFSEPWYYYPAYGEVVLAGWMSLGLPANWFNLAGWVMFTGVVYGLARGAKLSKEVAGMVAVTAAMWPTVVRLIPTQTVDIWVAVWWGAAVLQRQKNNLTWMGIFLGLLIGTKYSGLVFSALFLAGFWPRGSWRQWLVPMIGVGGLWYVRNMWLTGNPIYPIGAEYVAMYGGTPALAMVGGGWGDMVSALASEYLIWAGLLLLPIWVRNRWIVVGMGNFLAYVVLLPARPENLVSSLRYTLVVFVPLLIAGVRWAIKKGGKEVVVAAAVVGMAVELSQLDYHPKVFTLVLAGWVLIEVVRLGLRSGQKIPVMKNEDERSER